MNTTTTMTADLSETLTCLVDGSALRWRWYQEVGEWSQLIAKKQTITLNSPDPTSLNGSKPVIRQDLEVIEVIEQSYQELTWEKKNPASLEKEFAWVADKHVGYIVEGIPANKKLWRGENLLGWTTNLAQIIRRKGVVNDHMRHIATDPKSQI